MAGPKFSLVLGIAVAISIAATVGILVASSTLDQTANLARLVAFLGTLQIALAGYSRGLAVLANLSHYYEDILGFKWFYQDCAPTPDAPNAPNAPDATLGDLASSSLVRVWIKRRAENVSYDAAAPMALVGARSPEQAIAALLSVRQAETDLPLAIGYVGQEQPEGLEGSAALAGGLRLVRAGRVLAKQRGSNPAGRPPAQPRDETPEVPPETAPKIAPGLLLFHKDLSRVGQFGEQTLAFVQRGQLIDLAERGALTWKRLLNAAERSLDQEAAEADAIASEEDEAS